MSCARRGAIPKVHLGSLSVLGFNVEDLIANKTWAFENPTLPWRPLKGVDLDEWIQPQLTDKNK
jgi:hypothetical protein